LIDPKLAGNDRPARGLGQAPPVVQGHRKRWQMYGLAILCVIAAIALPSALAPIIGSHYSLITLLFFSVAVGLAGAAGGSGAGFAFLLVGAVWFLLVTRRYAPSITDPAALLSLALYGLSAGGIAVLVAAQRRARLRAEAGARNAKAKVERLERELAARGNHEERYRTPPDEARDSALYMLTPEGRHATWNKGISRILGYEKIEFLRLPPDELFTPEDRAQGVPEAEISEAIEQGMVSAERWMVRKDGTWIPVSVSMTSVLDQNGKLVGFAKRLRDLTEVRRIEEELRRHKEALELGYEAAGLGTWDHDLVTGELLLDQRARAMFGFHPDEPVTYSSWESAVHPEDLGPMEELRGSAIREQQAFSSQFRVLCPDGTTHWIAAVGRASYEQSTGKPLRMRGILLDITERKQTEERLQEVVRLEAIGRLAGGIAHDLNNMLVAILGFSDLLAQSLEPDDPRREDLNQITQAANQSANLTRQLLAFARRELIQPRRLELNAIVRHAAGILRPVVGENIHLVVRLSPELGDIHADRARVEQIVMNLVLNARDAMPQGGQVDVETETIELDATPPVWQPDSDAPPPGRYVVLSVRDTGYGMDPGTLQHIWEPFFTTKPTGLGTGLGLSVVYGSVKQSGGFVWVESEVGRGTMVRVYWPENPVAGEQPEDTAAPIPAQRGTETVLVVEDEPTVRALIVRTVTGFGYYCFQARDADEALELLKQGNTIDLVITDVVMPGMSGGRLGELLAREHPTVPVLYTSGFANDDVIRRGLLDASRPFLQKPFGPNELARKIREVLEASGVSQHQTA
jgi:two-component system, cell cycle sensor histidine kinase and response regulator CckA